MSRRGWVGSVVLLAAVLAAAAALTAWKRSSREAARVLAASQPEPTETVTAAEARPREHRRTTTSIGTVLALRSVVLRTEVPGTVKEVAFAPGEIVEEGAVLVALDVAVEEAELEAHAAQAALAETLLDRAQRASKERALSEAEVDRSRAERDVALANLARTKAVIAKKTLRAPFRARVGMADVHPGQYLDEGATITTLQGVGDAVHVDFAVAQHVAAGLREGDAVEVSSSGDAPRAEARIVAVDAKVDPATRNAWVRARLAATESTPPPGSSVRVRVPVGAPRSAVAIPVTGLRRGAAGDHVFVLVEDEHGRTRARHRPVESGSVLGSEVLVLAGLQAGERVAASGSFKLRDGVLVSVAPDDPGGTPANGH